MLTAELAARTADPLRPIRSAIRGPVFNAWLRTTALRALGRPAWVTSAPARRTQKSATAPVSPTRDAATIATATTAPPARPAIPRLTAAAARPVRKTVGTASAAANRHAA